ncbi:MAG: RelA/SpoT family protein [Muribaculaceae bacterium]|nr:RelA/SpoT family protein [Muribaculaceae bacterium]
MKEPENIKPKKLTKKEEDQLIESKFQDLLEGYLASNHRKKVEIIERAFRFAKEAHSGIRRRSGEPYILHPIAVAKIVSQEIGLGSTSICAALLHDVVEDTEYTEEDIEAQFGKKIASIVAGLTKISGGIFGDKASAQAENFRKLLLSMADDIRVILIKMADRLHNMRTLGSMLPSKQYKIAGETLYIYAPLAHRLGLFAIKTELEDLSFKYEHPEAYTQINNNIAASESQREHIYQQFALPVKKRLDEMGLVYEMKARVKSVYSIWNKMETKHIPFDEVYDLYAARIVFECPNEADEKRLCWNIYSEITDLYRLHPERTRDWVSTPKANGYRALHLTVMGPDGNWIEVQIRSRRMDELAERGFAAHWKYKIGEGEEESELAVWLKTIEDILNNPEPNAVDFLDTIKLNLFSSEIVVFTPKGELVTLPKNATVLDLAFNLHSELGMHCIAGKVNHKLVPLSHKLHSGDQVEVLTSHSQQPQESWLGFLTTAKGINRLRAVLRKDRRTIVEEGVKKFQSFLDSNNITISNELINKILSIKQLKNKDILYFAIGNNEVTLNDDLLSKISPKSNDGILSKLLRNPFSTAKSKEGSVVSNSEKINTKEAYLLTTIDGKDNYIIADCCHPIPGDDVLGYIDDNNRVIVHKLNCPTAMRLKSSFGGRLVATKWENTKQKFKAKIKIEGIDRMGILQEIIQIISTTLSIYIRSLNIEADNGVFNSELVVLVEDTAVVTHLCKKIKKIKGVTSVVRVNS